MRPRCDLYCATPICAELVELKRSFTYSEGAGVAMRPSPSVVQQVKLTGAGAKTGRDATAMRPRCDLYLLVFKGAGAGAGAGVAMRPRCDRDATAMRPL
jgi:hypothetical protein